jgi:hypothetical protein
MIHDAKSRISHSESEDILESNSASGILILRDVVQMIENQTKRFSLMFSERGQ